MGGRFSGRVVELVQCLARRQSGSDHHCSDWSTSLWPSVKHHIVTWKEYMQTMQLKAYQLDAVDTVPVLSHQHCTHFEVEQSVTGNGAQYIAFRTQGILKYANKFQKL
jgi:hypothetical protein